MSNEIKNLASGFIAGFNNNQKMTAVIFEAIKTFLENSNEDLTPKNESAKKAIADMVELDSRIKGTPPPVFKTVKPLSEVYDSRKKAYASFKSILNRTSKKVIKELGLDLRAIIIKDGALVEAQLRGSNSGEGGEGGAEGGNTSTDAPVTVTTTDIDTIATLTDMLEKATMAQQAALKIAIKALSV